MPEVDLTEDKSYSNLTTIPRSTTNVLSGIFRESFGNPLFRGTSVRPTLFRKLSTPMQNLVRCLWCSPETQRPSTSCAKWQKWRRENGVIAAASSSLLRYGICRSGPFVPSAHSAWMKPFMENVKHPGRELNSQGRNGLYPGGMTCKASFACTSLRTE